MTKLRFAVDQTVDGTEYKAGDTGEVDAHVARGLVLEGLAQPAPTEKKSTAKQADSKAKES